MSGEKPAHLTDDLRCTPNAAAASSRPLSRSFKPSYGDSTPLSVDFSGGSGYVLGSGSRNGGSGVLTFDVPSPPLTVVQMMAEVRGLGCTQFLKSSTRILSLAGLSPADANRKTEATAVRLL
jgi:hypothetical protein